jgi:hypothetical protein
LGAIRRWYWSRKGPKAILERIDALTSAEAGRVAATQGGVRFTSHVVIAVNDWFQQTTSKLRKNAVAG